MLLQITPIIIPMRSEPTRCPSCREIERTKTTCVHCGYEYRGKPTTFVGALAGTVACLAALALFMVSAFGLLTSFGNSSGITYEWGFVWWHQAIGCGTALVLEIATFFWWVDA